VRFDAIGEGCKLVLRAASIFGQSFVAAGVKALVGDMNDEDVDRWLEILVDKEILFCRPLGNTRQHVFRHALLQQAAYAMLTPKDEVSGHYMAADFLEHNGEREAIVLADHYEKGQQPAHAIRWLRVAANQAMEVDDLAAALARVERGVKLGAQGDDLAELRVVESEARYWKGEYGEAERAAREAQLATDSLLRIRAMSALVMGLGPQAKYDQIAQLALTLEQRPQDGARLSTWLECKANMAAFLASAGQFGLRAEMLALLESERDHLSPFLIGRIETTKAQIARMEGRPSDCVAAYMRAWQFFERTGYARIGSEALANAGSALLEVGQLEEAEAHVRKVLSTAERMGLRHLLGPVYYLLQNILTYRGCYDEARRLGELALVVTMDTNDQFFCRFARLYLSVLEYLANNFAQAEIHARHAIQMLANDPALQPFAHALLARALNACGNTVDALSSSEIAYRQLKALGGVQDGEPTIRLARAECLISAFDEPQAIEVLQEAVARLNSLAANIDSPDWRRSFLVEIPEHRRTLELASQLGIR
jgi:eukaryotic-like serine/threonine-protein kinase